MSSIIIACYRYQLLTKYCSSTWKFNFSKVTNIGTFWTERLDGPILQRLRQKSTRENCFIDSLQRLCFSEQNHCNYGFESLPESVVNPATSDGNFLLHCTNRLKLCLCNALLSAMLHLLLSALPYNSLKSNAFRITAKNIHLFSLL